MCILVHTIAARELFGATRGLGVEPQLGGVVRAGMPLALGCDGARSPEAERSGHRRRANMTTRRFPRPLHPVRVRTAQARLLDGPAASLVERVREVLCEPTRTQIVRALSAGPLSVGDLAITVGRSRSAISQHLRILRQDNVVQTRRRGRVSYYALTATLVARSSILVLDVVAEAAS